MANDHALGMAYPYGTLPLSTSTHLTPRFAHIIHLLRAPAVQISSFTAHSNKTYDFVLHTMEKVLPGMLGLPEASVVIEKFQEVRYGAGSEDFVMILLLCVQMRIVYLHPIHYYTVHCRI